MLLGKMADMLCIIYHTNYLDFVFAQWELDNMSEFKFKVDIENIKLLSNFSYKCASARAEQQ